MWIYADNKDKMRLNSSPQNSKAQKSLLMNDNSVFWKGFKYKMFSRPYVVIYPRNLKIWSSVFSSFSQFWYDDVLF